MRNAKVTRQKSRRAVSRICPDCLWSKRVRELERFVAELTENRTDEYEAMELKIALGRLETEHAKLMKHHKELQRTLIKLSQEQRIMTKVNKRENKRDDDTDLMDVVENLQRRGVVETDD